MGTGIRNEMGTDVWENREREASLNILKPCRFFFLKLKLCSNKNSFHDFFSMKADWVGDVSLPFHLL